VTPAPPAVVQSALADADELLRQVSEQVLA